MMRCAVCGYWLWGEFNVRTLIQYPDGLPLVTMKCPCPECSTDISWERWIGAAA